MHKNAIVLHGRPGKEEYYDLNQASASNAHWLAWLQNALLANNIHCYNPEVPLAFDPQYELWRKEFERGDINQDTILVGHSTGAGFIIKWMCENSDRIVSKIVLVAPYFDPFGEIEEKEFFKFQFDRDLSKRTKHGVTIFHSDNDMEDVQISTKQLLKEVDDMNYVEFHEYGHFCKEWSMNTDEFPELLEECLKS